MPRSGSTATWSGGPSTTTGRSTTGWRFVQVTPPGSACSICFGVGLGMMPEGSSQFIQVVVPDADAALAHLTERGVEATGVDEFAWGRFVNFNDPDGNRWALQQIVRGG